MTVFILSIILMLVLTNIVTAQEQEQENIDDKILMNDIQSLVFSINSKTTSRRGKPINQLTCKGKCTDAIDNALCKNIGIGDEGKPNWQCTSEFLSDITFGLITVSCEGYDNPDDKYILRGSCGLVYSLKYKNSNQERLFGIEIPTNQLRGGYNPYGIQRSNTSLNNINPIAIMFFGFFIYRIYKSFSRGNGGGFSNFGNSNNSNAVSDIEMRPYPNNVEDIALPAGFEMRYDDDLMSKVDGRKFFINHNTQTTTW